MEDNEWKQLRMLVRSVQEAVLNASATVDLIEEQAPFFQALYAASQFHQPSTRSPSSSSSFEVDHNSTMTKENSKRIPAIEDREE